MDKPAKVVAAADFRDQWHVVWLTPGPIQWPKSCACCRGTAESRGGPHIDKHLGQAQLLYPICRACRRHAAISERALYISIAIGFLLPGIAWLVFVGLPRPRAWVVLGPVYLIVGIGLSIALASVMGKLIPGMSRRCTADGWPIERGPAPHDLPLGGEKAERTDEREARQLGLKAAAQWGRDLTVLHVHNRAHALELIQLNGGTTQGIPRIATKY
jgi:hypothetical protein